jgi:enoyl-[acyl-carrier-protein] reductase (NADH)
LASIAAKPNNARHAVDVASRPAFGAASTLSIDDVGVAVAFLEMDGAKLITGETLYIDGGYHIID